MVTFYSTHCPKCAVLEKKLQQNNISYEEINDVNVMTQKGYKSVPMLEVDGVSMDFNEAVKWINNNNERRKQ